MSKKQTLEPFVAHPPLTNVAPTGDAGIAMSQTHSGAMRPSMCLVKLEISVAPADITMYVAAMSGGTVDDPTIQDSDWGLYNDTLWNIKNGVLGTGLVVGTHYFIVQDVGIFSRVYFTASAGVVQASIAPINFSGSGN